MQNGEELHLAPILKKAGVKDNGIEVIFFGHDEGEEETT